MQRWFFVEAAMDGESLKSSGPSSSDSSKSDLATRLWKFNCLVNQTLLPNEIVAITGGCQQLGNWQSDHCIFLERQVDDSNLWRADIEIPRDRATPYRYVIIAVNPITEQVIVRSWETHIEPRKILEFNDIPESNDIYGDADGVEKIDRGWLTSEMIVQFKFFNCPFKWKQRMKNRLLFAKVTPMSLKINEGNCNVSHSVSPLEDSVSNDTFTQGNGNEAPLLAFSESVNFKYEESQIYVEPQFGVQCGADDLVIFHLTIGDFENTAYLIDLFCYSSKAAQDEPPFHLGYHYILPNALKRSEGKLELPVTCATKHRPLGMMQVDYLLIRPLQSNYQQDMRVSYQRYWNVKWKGLDVGHRGSGTSFKAKDSVIRENTITSLKKAASHGADMVEFDVQLSKDLVPVIYHDFNVYVSLKSKQVDITDFLELPMRELTLEQLKNFKVYHVAEGRSREIRNFENEDWHEHQPFPQLCDVLDAIDDHVGFNIEVKWSQELVDGTVECDNSSLDRNLYVDCILDVVLKKGKDRRIVFSCFDPDICSMLRFKQNKYPVMFLTLGQTNRYIKYRDPRCNTIETAVCNARAMELLGIVAHTEDLLRDPTQFNLAKQQNLIVFCWGDDNNSKETIKLLKEMGLHAIIYDKIDVITPKKVRESVFLVQARENQNDLLKIQCLELGKNWQQEQKPYICDENEKVLELQKERTRIAVSTATSIASLLEREQN